MIQWKANLIEINIIIETTTKLQNFVRHDAGNEMISAAKKSLKLVIITSNNKIKTISRS